MRFGVVYERGLTGRIWGSTYASRRSGFHVLRRAKIWSAFSNCFILIHHNGQFVKFNEVANQRCGIWPWRLLVATLVISMATAGFDWVQIVVFYTVMHIQIHVYTHIHMQHCIAFPDLLHIQGDGSKTPRMTG